MISEQDAAQFFFRPSQSKPFSNSKLQRLDLCFYQDFAKIKVRTFMNSAHKKNRFKNRLIVK